MKVSKKAVAELKKNLPRGSARLVLDRLENKGVTFTIQYIYRCLNPKMRDYNPVIISEAINLCEEHTKNEKAIQKRINKVNKKKS